jgi:hypothetical protein
MRLITDILRDIRKGRPVEEATMALADVVRAVDETGKEGSVTITLKIKPSKHGGPEKTLIAEVKAKKPIAEIAPAVFFSDGVGDLHRVDPSQEEMPLGEVSRTDKPVMDASAFGRR